MAERKQERKSDAAQPAQILLVDVRRLLDDSAEGKRGKAALEARFTELQRERDAAKLSDAMAVARFEAQAARQLEDERERLRAALVVRIRAACDALRQQRGAALVLDRSLALSHDGALDVTQEVLAQLDR